MRKIEILQNYKNITKHITNNNGSIKQVIDPVEGSKYLVRKIILKYLSMLVYDSVFKQYFIAVI